MESEDNPEKRLIKERFFDFALKIIEYSELLEEKKKFPIANQLLRSGASVGANVREAQGAKSKPDFINKMKTAYARSRRNRVLASSLPTLQKLSEPK